MRHLPFDGILDASIFFGGYIQLLNAIMALYVDTPVWLLCLYWVLAIPGILSFALPAIGTALNGISYIRSRTSGRSMSQVD